MPVTEELTREATPSTHAGMGARLYDGGCSFRVWAPFADAVHIIGNFNDWDRDATPLASEENGYWSADISGVEAGDEYKYIIFNGDQELDRIDPYARAVTNSVGNAIVYEDRFDWGDDEASAVDLTDAIIYELHVGTFNPPSDDSVGTFETAIEKLAYLRDIGVSVIELMPLAEFAGDRSWGYNPAHPFAVEEAYGGPDALKALVKAAHEQGLKVILDVVFNHFGPSDLDLWQFDGWSENGKGGIYFYNDYRSNTPWGDTRPDYGRPAVQDYIVDNACMWLEEYHFDGLRLDMTPYVFSLEGHSSSERIHEGWQLIQRINKVIGERFPGRLVIAEDLQNDPGITLPPDFGGAGFNAQWDAAFVHPVRDVLTVASDEHRDLQKVVDALTHTYNGEPFSRVVYTESHDEVANGKARVPEEIWSGNADSRMARQRALMGIALTLTAPGIPMLFQGQELLEDEYFRDEVPLDWARLEEQAPFHQAVRDLMALRRNAHGQSFGLQGAHIDITHFDQGANVLAYHRWREGGAGDSTVVIMHFADAVIEDYAMPFPVDGRWKAAFNSNWNGYGEDFNDPGIEDIEGKDAHLTLGPYQVIVFTLS